MNTLDMLQSLKDLSSNYSVSKEGIDVYQSNNLVDSLNYLIEQKVNSKKTKFELKMNQNSILTI